MSTRKSPLRAVTEPVTASTFDGFYFRNNLASKGVVPAGPPFNLGPDIIQSPTQVADPVDTFSTVESWGRLYNTEPQAGTNYYYVRGLNGATTPFKGQLSLYWTPAEVILFPTLWENRPLRTKLGKKVVSAEAASGHIGVGADAFLLNWPTAAAQSSTSTFASFIAQNAATPIPTVSSWIEMSQILTSQLSFGFRNGVSFNPAANGGAMLQRLGLNIPLEVGQSGTLQFVLSATGLVGDTVGMIVDQYTAEQKAIQVMPSKVSQDSQAFGTQVTMDPGFSGTLAVQYWNTSQKSPAPGSTLTLTVNYVVPQSELEKAVAAGVLHSPYSAAAAKTLDVGVGPQEVAPLGQVTFITVAS
ncbi:MAG: hypothetical protein IPK82_27730 [Polyangiaceae bacterium]|nr:hypothetical protein [Polyangiaceae bacterium]